MKKILFILVLALGSLPALAEYTQQQWDDYDAFLRQLREKGTISENEFLGTYLKEDMVGFYLEAKDAKGTHTMRKAVYGVGEAGSCYAKGGAASGVLGVAQAIPVVGRAASEYGTGGNSTSHAAGLAAPVRTVGSFFGSLFHSAFDLTFKLPVSGLSALFGDTQEVKDDWNKVVSYWNDPVEEGKKLGNYASQAGSNFTQIYNESGPNSESCIENRVKREILDELDSRKTQTQPQAAPAPAVAQAPAPRPEIEPTSTMSTPYHAPDTLLSADTVAPRGNTLPEGKLVKVEDGLWIVEDSNHIKIWWPSNGRSDEENDRLIDNFLQEYRQGKGAQ